MNQWPQHKLELFEALWYAEIECSVIGNIFGILPATVSGQARYHGLDPRGSGYRRSKRHDSRSDYEIAHAIVAEHRKKHSPWLSKPVSSQASLSATPTVSVRSLSIQVAG